MKLRPRNPPHTHIDKIECGQTFSFFVDSELILMKIDVGVGSRSAVFLTGEGAGTTCHDIDFSIRCYVIYYDLVELS